MKNALLLIDIQNDYFVGGKSELVNTNKALLNAECALKLFRNKNLPVIHVQHINTREGATFFLPNTFGVEIQQKLTPIEKEFIVTKNFPNSFFATNLLQILRDEQITSLVVCGMMSHMCIDTTVRAAKDYDIKITLLDDACCTKNLSYNCEIIHAQVVHDVFMASLNGMFAQVIKTSELGSLPIFAV